MLALAKATKQFAGTAGSQDFDIVRFLEVDAPRIFPGFYLFIERDEEMGGSKSFVTEDSRAIVVAESVYNDACAGLFYAKKVLSHELGHLLLHHTETSHTKHFKYAPYQKQKRYMTATHSAEWQAETFAVLLLVPLEEVSRGRLEPAFQERHRISNRMSEYVAKRVASVKRNDACEDKWGAQIIVRSMATHVERICRADIQGVDQASASNVGEIQRSLFV